jgi:hypothetical protein
MWYDSSNAMYQVNYPIIQSIPPISTGMPSNILLSYIYLDSLLRFTSIHLTDSIIKNFTTLNDTIKGSAKILYELSDYNPVIFQQYSNEVTFYHKSIIDPNKRIHVIYKNGYNPDTVTTQYPTFPIYTNNLNDLSLCISKKMDNLLPDSMKNSIFAMLYSNYILRIKVLYIDSTMNLLMPNFNSKRFRVTAQVVDTLKGQYFNTISYQNIINKKNNGILEENYPIIQFEYIRENYAPGGSFYKDHAHTQLISEDPNFLNNNGFGMSPNQEAIVFLSFDNHLVDYNYDYYNLDICAATSYCALPIINGNVRDINNFWSSITLQDYNSWKAIFNSLKNKILFMSY